MIELFHSIYLLKTINKLDVANIVTSYEIIKIIKAFQLLKFIGPNSDFESIEIVQIIASIEDNLEQKELKDSIYLKIYMNMKSIFSSLINLIELKIFKN